MSGGPPTLAVVFVATDERRLLMEALESLSRCLPPATVEVVVVDNASADGTSGEVARRWPHVRVLRQRRRRGLSVNVNAGLRATTAPLVLVSNSDVAFRPAACAHLIAFMGEHPRAAIVAPRLVGPSGEVWPVARRWYTPASLVLRRLPLPRLDRSLSVRSHVYADWDGLAPRRVDWVLCAAAMLRREALGEIGLMDERFRVYFGDVDLARRAHDAGWEVWAVPDAEVLHHWRRASRRLLSVAWFSHLHALVQFVRKHGGLRPEGGKAPAGHVSDGPGPPGAPESGRGQTGGRVRP